MRITRSLLLFAVLAPFLAACQSSPIPYQPLSASIEFKLANGYIEKKLPNGQYLVVYSAPRQAVAENYVERRAAELAMQSGHPYFRIGTHGVRRGLSMYHDMPQWPLHADERTGPKIESLMGAPTTSINGLRYDAYILVTLLSADQARGQGDAVDARAVLQRAGAS